MHLKKIFKLVASLGALAGLSSFMTACDDESIEYPIHGTGDAHRCCVGLDSEAYDACIQDYQGSNRCDVNVALYGVQVPDPIIPGTKPAIEECCGDLSGAEYEACVEDYKAVGSCNSNISNPEADVYGPPPVDEVPVDEAMEECCGALSGEAYEACVEDYKAAGFCDMNVSLYGVPEPDPNEPPAIEDPVDEAIEECCGDLGGEAYEDCVAEYKEAGACTLSSTVYGVPSVPPDEDE
jgi:hypothetical protein